MKLGIATRPLTIYYAEIFTLKQVEHFIHTKDERKTPTILYSDVKTLRRIFRVKLCFTCLSHILEDILYIDGIMILQVETFQISTYIIHESLLVTFILLTILLIFYDAFMSVNQYQYPCLDFSLTIKEL